MAKSAYKYFLTDEDKAIAESNGVKLPTLYQRLKNGWEKEEAINTPPKIKREYQRNDKGEIISTVNAGKSRTFQLPEEYDEKFDQLLEESGLSASAYVREVMIRHLKRKK